MAAANKNHKMDFQICRNLHLYSTTSTSTINIKPPTMIHRLYLHGLQGAWVCDGFQCGHHLRLRSIAVEHGCPIGQLPGAAGVDGDPKGHRSGWQLQGTQRQGIGRGGTATVQLLTAGHVAQGWTHLGIDSDRMGLVMIDICWYDGAGYGRGHEIWKSWGRFKMWTGGWHNWRLISVWPTTSIATWPKLASTAQLTPPIRKVVPKILLQTPPSKKNIWLCLKIMNPPPKFGWFQIPKNPHSSCNSPFHPFLRFLFHGIPQWLHHPHHPHLFPAVIRHEDPIALDALHRHLPTGVRLPKLQGTSHPTRPGIGVDEGSGAADLHNWRSLSSTM